MRTTLVLLLATVAAVAFGNDNKAEKPGPDREYQMQQPLGGGRLPNSN
jgi:hypothetical protein